MSVDEVLGLLQGMRTVGACGPRIQDHCLFDLQKRRWEFAPLSSRAVIFGQLQ